MGSAWRRSTRGRWRAADRPGLYICGEVLDAFGPIGGYNFLWAWATGRAAGIAAARGAIVTAGAGGQALAAGCAGGVSRCSTGPLQRVILPVPHRPSSAFMPHSRPLRLSFACALLALAGVVGRVAAQAPATTPARLTLGGPAAVGPNRGPAGPLPRRAGGAGADALRGERPGGLLPVEGRDAPLRGALRTPRDGRGDPARLRRRDRPVARQGGRQHPRATARAAPSGLPGLAGGSPPRARAGGPADGAAGHRDRLPLRVPRHAAHASRRSPGSSTAVPTARCARRPSGRGRRSPRTPARRW